MNPLTSLHREAMEFADQAFVARLKGDLGLAQQLFRKAFELESKAAEQLISQPEAEPSRSVLLRSAATLALDIENYREAERLVCLALAGNPPTEIANELRDLYEQVNFNRHLELRGVTLAPEEFQMSIAGKGVGFGIVQTDEFVDRVSFVEKLIYRTAERRLQKPYRDSGRLSDELRDRFGLFTSVPRAASFAVTFRLGTQTELLPYMNSASAIVDELFDCLQLFNNQDDSRLKEVIPEEAYYRNFVSLAKQIAPDGKDISLVGLTAAREGGEKRVEITRQKKELLPLVIEERPKTKKTAVEHKEITGTLRFADGTRGESGKIRLVDDAGEIQSIVVPQGLSDVVRSLWDYKVTVRARVKGKRLVLADIDKNS